MSFKYKFEKIQDIKEREKEKQALAYEKSIQNFNVVAERLYELLKKKEDMEENQFSKIQTGIPIQEIRLQQKFLINLQKEVDHYQNLVVRARHNMQYEENRLIEKNIEVKKLEKIKEKEYKKYLYLLDFEESKGMDEIAMQIVARGN